MKRLLWTVGFLSSLFAMASVALMLMDYVQKKNTLYATPEMESNFLRDYSPVEIVKPFSSDESNFSGGGGMAAGAGPPFVTHTRDFHFDFAMRTRDELPLMTALHDHLLAQLAKNKAIVLSQRGDMQSGMHFDYRLGKSVGAITLYPIDPDSGVGRNTPLPVGIADVALQITIAEQWYPKEASAVQAAALIVGHLPLAAR